MKYEEFEPHINLASFVRNYGVIENSAEKHPQKITIVPEGSMKMIFHYGDLYEYYDEWDNCAVLPRCYVIGQLTKPFQARPTGKTGLFYVHFHPHGFRPFTQKSLNQMRDSPIPISQLFDDEGRVIEHKILNAETTKERICGIESFLFSQLSNKGYNNDGIKSIVEAILVADGQISVKELTLKTDVHRRNIERKFSTDIGLSPKQLLKTIRLKNVLKSLLRSDETQLTEIAYENEYYDQAHFIKEFKELTKLTPKEFYKNELLLYRLFYT